MKCGQERMKLWNVVCEGRGYTSGLKKEVSRLPNRERTDVKDIDRFFIWLKTSMSMAGEFN